MEFQWVEEEAKKEILLYLRDVGRRLSWLGPGILFPGRCCQSIGCVVGLDEEEGGVGMYVCRLNLPLLGRPSLRGNWCGSSFLLICGRRPVLLLDE